MTSHTSILLASSSPRRQTMLADAGAEFEVVAPVIDDSELRRGSVTPEQWVAALAYMKARSGELQHFALRNTFSGVILAADTVCAFQNEIYGQPKDQQDARRMLMLFQNATHRTLTGVCLRYPKSNKTTLFTDSTIVRVGEIDEETINTYLKSGMWEGKAGGYNLVDRQHAGWPITCEGDPTTVMGLPMKKLLPILIENGNIAS